MDKDARWLGRMMFIWRNVITLAYFISAVGFIFNLPIGLITLFIFGILHFPMPLTLMYQGIRAGAGVYVLKAWYYWPLFLINMAGVLVSFLGIKNIKKQWKWGYIFIGLVFLQFGLVTSNFFLGSCKLDAGDGGMFLDRCQYGIAGTWDQFIATFIALVIALWITELARRKQTSNGLPV